MAVPYVFANATSAIPLSNLDNNFSTPITIGNVAIQLGNTATTLGNVTMANVTITSVSSPITVTQGGTGNSSAFTANAVVYAPTTSTLATGSALTFNGTNLSTTGTMQVGTTLGVGAATPSASGSGITFPATQSASSNVNTLDDYETGTWTPTLVPGGTGFTSITYDADTQAKYVKIGKNVFVQGSIRTLAIVIGSPTGILTVGNFPFTMSTSSQGGNGTSAYSSLSIAYASSWGGSNVPAGLLTVSGSTIGYLTTRATSNGDFAYASSSNVATGAYQNTLYFAGCYISAN